MDTTYIGLTETATLLRADLKTHFPGVKFSVRTKRYSMGQSIYVSWTDGPTTKSVEAVSDHYQGQRFEGIDDSTHTVYAERDGKRVHYGANYVMTNRHLTREHLEDALRTACRDDANYTAAYLGARDEFVDLPAYDDRKVYQIAHTTEGRIV